MLLHLSSAHSAVDRRRCEVAIRAWAARDKQVQALLHRVDALRMDFARESARAVPPCQVHGADIEAFAQLAYPTVLYVWIRGGLFGRNQKSSSWVKFLYAPVPGRLFSK